jgi:phage shock protein A
MDALDRGVVEAGLLAAQALARAEALEAALAGLEARVAEADARIAQWSRTVYRLGFEADVRRARGEVTSAADAAQPCQLHAVPPIGGQQ